MTPMKRFIISLLMLCAAPYVSAQSNLWGQDGAWHSVPTTIPAATDVQAFTATGANTWTKPSGSPVLTRVIICGAGGAGGGGASVISGTGMSGGGGGGSGWYADISLKTSSLGATETVTIGTGG